MAMNFKKYNIFIRYANMATQLFVGLGITLWLGKWLDEKLAREKPLLTWIFPMFYLIGYLVKLIKDTNKK
ncbi:MAG: AtpZ/AtpI family protein [Chitinophagaceae bacterium]|nr:AtpZ/AtpI family protein [Chitinophagaceae bacterium]MCW5905954.1 AtpZ/AtpI family protein [Chitinophagaceae bacterium]